ncbi:hypothetical protein F4818DRAFT_409201 [Hypoxylon cercidicola]|nr:hypothetical protein F4818DRAFT_409201 [Hypoxylon cercidicola]
MYTNFNPTPSESSFTPIKKPPKSDPISTSSLRRPASSVADEEIHNVSSGEISLDAHNRNLKRNRTTYGGDDVRRSKRQLSQPATPSDSPFQTLRVTKSSNISNRKSHIKAEDTSSCDDASQAQSTGPRPPGLTTIEQLTPYPAKESHESRRQLNQDNEAEYVDGFNVEADPHFSNDELVPATPFTTCTMDFIREPLFSIPFEQSANFADTFNSSDPIFQRAIDRTDEYVTTPVSRNVDATCDSENEYPLDDDLVDEDMTSLLDLAPDNVQETHVPPSSVTISWDHDSRSAAEYDPTLQYSSPLSPSEALKRSQAVGATEKLGVGQDDLLDEDVDWNTVYALVDKIPKVPVSNISSQNTRHPFPTDQTPCAENTIEQGSLIEDTIPSKPFSRPSFPGKVRDRSIVPGLSSDAMLRTCFRIGEMINQAVHCLKHEQAVVFEFFARVTYSSRESLAKKQHFQFVDLFTDQQPYPGGTLANWRAGGQIDRQSMTFLDKSTKRKVCRCLCKPKRDRKTEIGFTLIVLAIREADWPQIEWAKKVVCGESDEQRGFAVDAKI